MTPGVPSLEIEENVNSRSIRHKKGAFLPGSRLNWLSTKIQLRRYGFWRRGFRLGCIRLPCIVCLVLAG
jgi:hypothetical protein